jgi:hypothetical protein
MLTIGAQAIYTGQAHPYLAGHTVQIVAVHKGYWVDPDRATIISDPAELARAGGIDPLQDMVEVRPVAADGRLLLGSSDTRLADLQPLFKNP